MHETVPVQHEQDAGESASPDEAAVVRLFPDLESISVALEAGGVGVWSWDVRSDVVKWSANMERIHGLPAGSFDGTFSAFQKDIHPEDQPEVFAALQESVRSGKPYHVHYRLAADGGKLCQQIKDAVGVIGAECSS